MGCQVKPGQGSREKRAKGLTTEEKRAAQDTRGHRKLGRRVGHPDGSAEKEKEGSFPIHTFLRMWATLHSWSLAQGLGLEVPEISGHGVNH